MEATMNEIIEIEWQMFQKVNEHGPRAECQNNRKTFEGMRRGQFEAWSQNVRESYAADLAAAVSVGRNLVQEKYIRMMKWTSPHQYHALEPYLPVLTQQQCDLAKEINQLLVAQAENVFMQFPHVAAHGRPLHQVQARPFDTSVEVYQLGELLTYSENTLLRLREHILAQAADGVSLFRQSFENSLKFYGWTSLEEAESAAEKALQRPSPSV